MRAAVVGHVEYVTFLRVGHVPAPGEIVHALESYELPAGGGPGAAVQLLKLAGECTLFTALGDDDLGHRCASDLEEMGLRMEVCFHPTPTRRAVTHVDAHGERTITVIGDRLEPRGDDPLAWDLLGDCDAVYFTAGDAGALKKARAARSLVATARVFPRLQEAGVELDALVGSAVDPAETYEEGSLEPPPKLVVRTHGGRGGTFAVRGESEEHFEAVGLTAPVVDRYGAGDSFAGALAYFLGRGSPPGEAVRLAGRCGAAVLYGRGPYETQLSSADLAPGRG